MKHTLPMLVALLLVPPAALSAGDAPKSPETPNIVYIEVDDLCYKYLGCFGNKAMRIEPIPTHQTPSLTAGAKATASSEHDYLRPSGKRVRDAAANVLPAASGNAVGDGTAQACPDSAYWTASRDNANPWVVVDLGRPREFQQVSLVEMHTRIRRFVVECYEESTGAWNPICQGGHMNYYSARLQAPVNTRKVRLRILESQGGPPQVVSFNLYP